MQALEIYETSATKPQQRWCPHCGSFDHSDIDKFSPSPWRIVSCAECEFVYLANPVSYDELAEEQAWEKNYGEETARRRADRPLLDQLSKATRWRVNFLGRDRTQRFLKVFQQGRVLDIGCGLGTALPQPLVPFGVEISKYLSGMADQVMRQRGGYCVQGAATEGIKEFDDFFFDGVLLHSFLEHETNPLPLLVGLHRILNNEGVVYVRVPNFSSLNRHVMGRKWCGFRYPDHVNYFTVKSLGRMAEKAGFSHRILNRANIAVDDNIKMLLSKIKIGAFDA